MSQELRMAHGGRWELLVECDGWCRLLCRGSFQAERGRVARSVWL